MKALEKDRNRRYETGQRPGAWTSSATWPTSRCRPARRRLRYRLRKFVRRHKGPVLAATLVLLALLAASSARRWGWCGRWQPRSEAKQA